MSKGGKYVSKPSDIPDGPHWAIITTTSVHIPGDQRSRDAPGHGYPERTESYISYEAFASEDDLKAEAERRLQSSFSRTDFICIHVDKIATPKIRAEIDWA